MSGDEPREVTCWWSGVTALATAPVVHGSAPADQMLRVGQVSVLLGLEAASLVVEVTELRALEPRLVTDGSIIVWSSKTLSESDSRMIAAARASAARVVVATPLDVAPVADPWMANVDLLVLLSDGDCRWRPAGSETTEWRTVAEVKAARQAKRDEKAAAARAIEDERLRLVAEQKAREASAEALRQADRQLELDHAALATKTSRGELVPSDGQPIPADFWVEPCPWCGNGALDLPPSDKDRAGVLCPACGKKSRRSRCSRCRGTAVIRLGGYGEVCTLCRQVESEAEGLRREAAAAKRAGKAARPTDAAELPKKRRWFLGG